MFDKTKTTTLNDARMNKINDWISILDKQTLYTAIDCKEKKKNIERI